MRRTTARILVVALIALAGIGWNDRAHAGGPGADRLDRSWTMMVVPATDLDGMRGGFVLPSGLQLSFGIERVAWVNGQMVSYLRVDIPDIAHMTPAQAQELSKLARTQLVQVGPGNVFRGGGNGGLVIQNTLDGQDIRARTTLDVSVNTLGLFQALNIGDALNNAVINAPGSP